LNPAFSDLACSSSGLARSFVLRTFSQPAVYPYRAGISWPVLKHTVSRAAIDSEQSLRRALLCSIENLKRTARVASGGSERNWRRATWCALIDLTYYVVSNRFVLISGCCRSAFLPQQSCCGWVVDCVGLALLPFDPEE